jgi:DNA-binding transcriptional MocR family regulator
MMLIKIARPGSAPVYLQIVDQFRKLIESESLETGTILPPTREIAGRLGINRSTVFRAYQELLALGFIDSRPGSYTTVRARPKTTLCTPTLAKSALDWDTLSTQPSKAIYNRYLTYAPEIDPMKHPGVVNLTALQVDRRLFPVAEVRRCVNRVLAQDGANVLEYGDAVGYYSLREYIARRMRLHGVATSAREVLVTNGAHHGLELILKLFTRPGSCIAVESPGYAAFLPLLAFYQVQAFPVPIDRRGIRLESVRALLQRQKLSFIYTIPNFQNPTGFTSTQAHREELLRLCEENATPLVEDGFEEEMKYAGKVTMPIKSMDTRHVVVYVGTFSKVLFPGFRIGWISAHQECVDRLAALKRFSDLTSSTFTQRVLCNFCESGYYDRHLRMMHRQYRKRMRVALLEMRHHLSGLATWTEPEGGYTIWGRLNRPYGSEKAFKEVLMRHGVAVSPGHYFFGERQSRRNFRLSIAAVNEKEIKEGIRRLGVALRKRR